MIFVALQAPEEEEGLQDACISFVQLQESHSLGILLLPYN
jgi:hypothetical protein